MARYIDADKPMPQCPVDDMEALEYLDDIEEWAERRIREKVIREVPTEEWEDLQ